MDTLHYTYFRCYACSTAKPLLTSSPFPALINDYNRTLCLLTLLSSRVFSNDSDCADMHWKFPPVQKTGHIPPVSNLVKEITRFTQYDTDGKNVGRFPQCALTYNTTDIPTMNFSTMLVARADVWWYYKTTTLRPTLPKNWKGTCALCSTYYACRYNYVT